MSSYGPIKAEDLLPLSVNSAKAYQDALAEYAQKITDELNDLDRMLSAASHANDESDFIQLSVTLSDTKKAVGLLSSSQLNHSSSPFADEASQRARYLQLTTPRALKPKELDIMEMAIKNQNERLRAMQFREHGFSDIDVETNTDGIDWDIIAEKMSDSSEKHKWVAEECRFKWIHEQTNYNQKEWNNEEIDRLKKILAQSSSETHNWVEFANKLGTNRLPLDCMRKALQIQVKPVFKWEEQDDQRLLEAINIYGIGNWSIVARYVSENVSGPQCDNRYHRFVSGAVQKGVWSEEEDQRLDAAIAGWGRSWMEVSASMYGRTNDQCRDRYLERKKNTEPWTDEEERMLLNSYEKLGAKWSIIAKMLDSGRTDNDCRHRLKKLKNWTETPPQPNQSLPDEPGVDVEPADAVVSQGKEKPKPKAKGKKKEKAKDDYKVGVKPSEGWLIYPYTSEPTYAQSSSTGLGPPVPHPPAMYPHMYPHMYAAGPYSHIYQPGAYPLTYASAGYAPMYPAYSTGLYPPGYLPPAPLANAAGDVAMREQPLQPEVAPAAAAEGHDGDAMELDAPNASESVTPVPLPKPKRLTKKQKAAMTALSDSAAADGGSGTPENGNGMEVDAPESTPVPRPKPKRLTKKQRAAMAATSDSAAAADGGSGTPGNANVMDVDAPESTPVPRPKANRVTKKQSQAAASGVASTAGDGDPPPPVQRPKPKRVTKKQQAAAAAALSAESNSTLQNVASAEGSSALDAEPLPGPDTAVFPVASASGHDDGAVAGDSTLAVDATASSHDAVDGKKKKKGKDLSATSAPRRTSQRVAAKMAGAALTGPAQELPIASSSSSPVKTPTKAKRAPGGSPAKAAAPVVESSDHDMVVDD